MIQVGVPLNNENHNTASLCGYSLLPVGPVLTSRHTLVHFLTAEVRPADKGVLLAVRANTGLAFFFFKSIDLQSPQQ